MAAAVVLAYPPFVPHGWHAPRWWLGHPSDDGSSASGAYCIHEHEGSFTSVGTGRDRYGRVILFYGGYQFMVDTWRRVGGRGRPDHASPREQTYRAWLLWNRDGGSWREWPTARACGLR